MSIVFGWNSFKIRSFSLKDLGINQKAEAGIRIEVRQKYFHLFWIPFFSLGKEWVVRKGNQLYEMPFDLQMLVETSASATSVAAARARTPFYTYAGPLLIIIGLLIYQIDDSYSNYKYKQRVIQSFNTEKAVLKSKLQHLTTKDFISVLRFGYDGMDTTIYLKIEDIKGDEIIATPVEMSTPTQGLYAKAWEVEDEYTRHANTLPSVKISYKQLQTAYAKEFSSSSDREALKRLGINLLNDGRSYLATAVVRHFGPIVSGPGTGGYGDRELYFDMYNEGWPATISDIKELTGNGDWSKNLNKEVPGHRFGLFGPAFTLSAVNYTYGKPYKIIMTLKDTTGQLHKYEIAGVNMNNTVKEL
jgi:hypothetical protein